MKHRALIISLLLSLLWGCQRINTDGSGDDLKLSISARLGVAQVGSAQENQVNSLRVIIFSQSGVQVYNELKTDAALAALSDPSGEYTLNVTVARKTMKIYLIANEQTSWDLTNPIDEAALRNLAFDHTAGADQVLPFTMFSKHSIDVASLTGDTYRLSMGLARNAVKVSLSLECIYSQVAGLGSGTLTVTQAYIENTPLISYLTPNIEYKSSNVFQATASQNFTVIPSGATGFITNIITFYIPEHIISEANVAAENYTKVVVRGAYTPSGGSPIDIFYTIPLGSGIDRWYQGGKISPLTKSDLTVQRNTHYNLSARVTSIGELDGLKLFVKVAPWEDGADVDGDLLAPYLNISDLLTVAPTRVYFWSNRSEIFVLEDYCKRYSNGLWVDVEGGVETVFDGLIGSSASNFVLLFPSNAGQYTQYNGYMDLKAKQGIDLNNNAYTPFSIMINAGGLKRSITVNVQSPSILFDYNGGVSADRMPLANAADGENAYVSFEGDGLTIGAIPMSLVPPSGTIFSHWNTAMDGLGDRYNQGQNIELKAGVTTLFAIYEKI